MNQSEIKQICEKILGFSNADEAEVIFHQNALALTRFANNQIEQNVAENVNDVTFRGVWGKKTARVTSSKYDDESLKRLVTLAEEAASVQREIPDLEPVTSQKEYETVEHFDEATAACTPETRAEGVSRHVAMVKEKGLVAAGIFSTSMQTVAIANTAGLYATDSFTSANFSSQVMGDVGSGLGAATRVKVQDIDIEDLSNRAIDKCLGSEKPTSIEPGEYTVVLEPAAASNLLMFTGHLGFNALAHMEGRSPFANKVGEKVFGDNITIEDNAYNDLAPGVPFDFEGMPRQQVKLIENGVLKNIVHDRRTARAMNTETTGHGLPVPNPNGPYPMNLVLQPGDKTPEEIIKDTKKGVLVTQFHYTNMVNPMRISITGMTRNGTFLIEDGKVTSAVKNMRFTESVIKALSNVTAIGCDLTLASSTFGGGYLVPTLRIDNFTFSSKTDF